MGRSQFLGVHRLPQQYRTVCLERRGRSRYRVLFLDTPPSSLPGVPWGGAIPATALSVKVSAFSAEEDSWRERELETIETRREPQGEGSNLRVISVATQRREVQQREQAGEDGRPARIDAEPLAFWAARQVLAPLPDPTCLILHALPEGWILLFLKDGILTHATHIPREGAAAPEVESRRVVQHLQMIARVFGLTSEGKETPVELSGQDSEDLRGVEEGLRAGGWQNAHRVSPSKKFRRRFKGAKDLTMGHAVALGIALRGLRAAAGLPALNFAKADSPPAKLPWYTSLRMAAALAALCVLAWVASMELSVRTLEKEAGRLRMAIGRYEKRIEATADPRREDVQKILQTRIGRLRGEIGRLESVRYPRVTVAETLASLMEVFSREEAFQVQEVSLDGENISLRGSLKDLQSVTAIQEALRKLPLIRAVALLSARSVKDRVEASFRLAGPAWRGKAVTP